MITEAEDAQVRHGSLACHACSLTFSVENGLPRLLYPETLNKETESVQAFYDQRPLYDYRPTAFRLGIWSLAFRRNNDRQKWAELLELKEGHAVLEVGCGNGKALPYLCRAVGEPGRVDGIDLSLACLQVAHDSLMHEGVSGELIQGNASYLPYKSDMYDGVLSIGGFNDFVEKEKAINDMYRVLRPGGTMVLADEGMSEKRKKSILGRYISKNMKVFEQKPPERLIPPEAMNSKTLYMYQETFWVLKFQKA
jgi:ubiquinone/menaquinone biosynthesis C-methylase UbiE